MSVPVLVFDGVTKLPPEANGAIVIGGSNATIYAAYFSAKAGARAPFIMTAASVEMRRGSEVCLGPNNMAWLWRQLRPALPAPATPETCSSAASSVASTRLRPIVV